MKFHCLQWIFVLYVMKTIKPNIQLLNINVKGGILFINIVFLKWLKMPMNKAKVCPSCKQLPDSIHKYVCQYSI
ncbi:unnamed protein product [Paramecium octaurelia]|uniref:Uncharacterized protein n=1 Tax=Paramecium octaurelia TaxID=43137 RepID=A0A8S1U6R4_PAROT|nr:unnamed protein product [Paramecium octaurelia]